MCRTRPPDGMPRYASTCWWWFQHSVATRSPRSSPSASQPHGERPRAPGHVGVGVAVEALVGQARDDLGPPEVRLRAAQQRREGELEVHHHAVHRVPPRSRASVHLGPRTRRCKVTTDAEAHPCRRRARGRARRGPHERVGPRVRRPGRDPELDPAGRDDAALGARLRIRLGRARRRGVLQVRERARRRQRPPDHLHVPRRRLQPVADGAGDPSARRAGQDLRRLRQPRHRAEPGDSRLPRPARGAAGLRRHRRAHLRRRLQEVPGHDRLPADLRRRGLHVRPLHPHDEAEGEDRRALPERRLRQGAARRGCAPGSRRSARRSSRRRASSRPRTTSARRSRPSRARARTR